MMKLMTEKKDSDSDYAPVKRAVKKIREIKT
jgi:hypothetical protein